MIYFQGQWSKFKHRMGKESPGRFGLPKRFSISSIGSSRNAPSTVISARSPILNSNQLVRPESHTSSQPRTPIATASSVEEGYVVVSQNPPTDQDHDRQIETLPEEVISQTPTQIDTERIAVLSTRQLSRSERELPSTPPSKARSAKSATSQHSTSSQPGHNSQKTTQDNAIPRQRDIKISDIPSQGLLGSKNEWDKLRSLRKDALGLRSLVQKQRSLLLTTGAAVEKADGAFVRYTRAHPPVNPAPTTEWSLDALQKLHTEIQRARNEHGPVLVECMQRDEALDIVEFEMGRIEDHLYVLLFGNIPDETTIDPASSLENATLESPANPSPWLGLVAGVQDRFQPLQTKYLSRLGDWDLAKERLGILRQEMEDLLAEQESLFKVRRELSDESKATLRDFPAREAQLREEVIEIQKDVENIKQECIEAGIDLDEGSDDGSGYSLSVHEEDRDTDA